MPSLTHPLQHLLEWIMPGVLEERDGGNLLISTYIAPPTGLAFTIISVLRFGSKLVMTVSLLNAYFN